MSNPALAPTVQQVWQELSTAFTDRYVRLERFAGDEFGETFSPTSQEISSALRDAAPTA